MTPETRGFVLAWVGVGLMLFAVYSWQARTDRVLTEIRDVLIEIRDAGRP